MFKKYSDLIFLDKVNEMVISDKVDKLALSKIRRSFTQIITNWGFFADLLFNLSIHEVPDNFCQTMCTDGKSIGYSSTFVKNLSLSEINFVIIHEIMHNANFHFNRMSNREPELWNWAADYAINLLINDMCKDFAGLLKTPNEILLDEKYRNMSAEQIYDKLLKEGKGQGQGQGKGKSGDGQGSGKPGDGQGSGKPGQGSGGLGPDDIKRPGSIERVGKEVYEGGDKGDNTSDAKELEKKWKEILQKTKSKGVGSSAMDRWIRKLNKPKVDWRRELRNFVNNIYNELDFAFYNRKFISAGDYWPGIKNVDKSMFSDVIISIDTSGSITDDTLNKFASELYKLFKSYEIERCYVIWCDSDIPKDGIQIFDRVDSNFKLTKLKPKGGGGTSFVPPFKWVEENVLKSGRLPAFFIYFTDAYGDAPKSSQYGIKNYQNRILWVITENENASNINFGKKIYIDKLNP